MRYLYKFYLFLYFGFVTHVVFPRFLDGWADILRVFPNSEFAKIFPQAILILKSALTLSGASVCTIMIIHLTLPTITKYFKSKKITSFLALKYSILPYVVLTILDPFNISQSHPIAYRFINVYLTALATLGICIGAYFQKVIEIENQSYHEILSTPAWKRKIYQLLRIKQIKQP